MDLTRCLAVITVGTALCASLGCGSDDDSPFAGYESEQYANLAHWMCHPGLDATEDVCASADLDATEVHPDGSTTLLTHTQAAAPEVDCFYVYPTASMDSSPNSDLEPGDEEIFTTVQQAARFNSLCRLFAPVYRQVTLTALIGGGGGDRELAYDDVTDAFKHYIANESDGRAFLLIGHSQGSSHLGRLVAEEIENQPALAQRMIAAYLIGMTMAVPVGEDVGGTFATTPLCRAADQTGCVVTFASYRATDPPGENALFGRTDDPDTRAGCNNPAALAGGAAVLDSYFPMELPGIMDDFINKATGPFADPDAADTITTPFFKLPGLVEGECVAPDDRDYLEVVVHADEEDPRANDIGGDFTDGWGLHVADVNLTQGDLIHLAENQTAAWLAGH
jgi:hypothetical protein